uniref:Bromo domain-containing protein n=1 Tax=Chenopodium quinoa TaxID=63459 RepID=A0A803LFT7_CHEQI
EELLLACAVQRHGIDAWDSVSRELQNRTSFSHFTPLICQQKYRDLKRRFASDIAGEIAGDDAGLWLEELRRLRVAELRRDLQRYDLSIVSLQLKVKKLKEERESNVKEEIKEEREKISDPKKIEERETEIDEVKTSEAEPDEPVGTEPGRASEPVGGEEDDSCNGSSNSKEERRSEQERRERVDSGELVESVAESRDDGGCGGGGCREKKIGVFSGNSSGEENQSPAVKANGEGKLRSLVEFLDVVRARKLGSFFERRLESQENPKYTNLIKQHIDLETIQRRLEEGQYSDCQTKFYRDLMLLINNAIVFFTKRSSEHKAALELRQLLNKQFQPHLSSPQDHKSRPSKPVQPAPLPKPTKPEANQADLKQPSLTVNGLVIACRKRSSIAGKSSRGVSEKREPAPVTPPDEKASIGEMVKQQREKASSTSFNAVTKKRTRDQSFGSRSSSSRNNSNPNPNTPISSKGESSEVKADKKKPSPGNSSNKVKQVSGSASGKTLFLQSLKNSDKRKTGNGDSSGNVKSDRRKDEGPQKGSGSKLSKEKTGKEERESPGNRSSSRPPKRAAAIAAMGKRGRDGGSVDVESHSKKRQR